MRYGLGGITIGTAHDVSIAVDAAYFIVAYFCAHSFQIKATSRLGHIENTSSAETDRLCSNATIEPIVTYLINKAYLEAKQLVTQKMKSIDKIAALLVSDPGVAINGDVLLECMLMDTPSDMTSTTMQKQKYSLMGLRVKEQESKMVASTTVSALFRVSDSQSEPSLPICQISTPTVFGKTSLTHTANAWKMIKDQKRLRATYDFTILADSKFPPAPIIPEYKGFTLEEWMISAESLEAQSIVDFIPFEDTLNK